jgi:hypothetical protein
VINNAREGRSGVLDKTIAASTTSMIMLTGALKKPSEKSVDRQTESFSHEFDTIDSEDIAITVLLFVCGRAQTCEKLSY